MEFLSVNIAIENNSPYAQEILRRIRTKLDSLAPDASEFIAPSLWSLEDGLKTFYEDVDKMRYDKINAPDAGKGFRIHTLSRVDQKRGSLLVLVVNFDMLKSATTRKKLIESIGTLKTHFAGVVLFALSEGTLKFQDNAFPRRLSYDFSTLLNETWVRIVVASYRTRSDESYVVAEEVRDIVVNAIAEEIVVVNPNDVNTGMFRFEPDKFSFGILGGRVLLRNDEELAKTLTPRYMGDALKVIAVRSSVETNDKFELLEESRSRMTAKIFDKIPNIKIENGSLESVDFCDIPIEERITSRTKIYEIIQTIKDVDSSCEQLRTTVFNEVNERIKQRKNSETVLLYERFIKAFLARESLSELKSSMDTYVKNRYCSFCAHTTPPKPALKEIEDLIKHIPSMCWIILLPLVLGLSTFLFLVQILFLSHSYISFVAFGVSTLGLLVSGCVSFFFFWKRLKMKEKLIETAMNTISEYKNYHRLSLQRSILEECSEVSIDLGEIITVCSRELESVVDKLNSYVSYQYVPHGNSNIKKVLEENRYSEFLTWLEKIYAKEFETDVNSLLSTIKQKLNSGLKSGKISIDNLIKEMGAIGKQRLFPLFKTFSPDVFLRNPFNNPKSGLEEFYRLSALNDVFFASGSYIREALAKVAKKDKDVFTFTDSRVYVSSPMPVLSEYQSNINVKESPFSNVCVAIQTLTLLMGELSQEDRQELEKTFCNEKEEEPEFPTNEAPETSDVEIEENVSKDASSSDELIRGIEVEESGL